MNRLWIGLDILRQYGLSWVLYRLRISILHRLGWEERLMAMDHWENQVEGLPPTNPPMFPRPSDEALRAFAMRFPSALATLREEAEAILAGTFRKFEQDGEAIGFPPPWNEELPGRCHPEAGTHWNRIRPFEDIKLVWELSRMSWAQILGRTYAWTGEERFAEGFWELLEDWCRHNQPNQGPQWMCGQETALRGLSLALTEGLLRDSPSSTPERIVLLRGVIRAGARRILPHIHYARSQRNNHALTEALGLLTGAFISQDGEESRHWADLGGRFFPRDLFDQLDEEGSYIQHSTYYHRVMLHACSWWLVLKRARGETSEMKVRELMVRGMEWMVSMVDPATGFAPNLGSNDGANILRLTACTYEDQRPALQGLAAQLGLPLPYPAGPWDESVLWLTGLDPTTLPRQTGHRRDLSAHGRGHYLRQFPEGSLYFRCAGYKERPSQSDPLHVDLTWRGINVLCDAGTYRYNAPQPWSNSLAHTGAHNTVTLNGRPSMGRLGPFLWLDWDRARLIQKVQTDWLVGERLRTRTSPMLHRRSMFLLGPGHWIIVDDVAALKPERFQLHWLLPESPWTPLDRGVLLETPSGPFQILVLGSGEVVHVCGSEGEPMVAAGFAPLGWRSSCYFHKEPAISLITQSPKIIRTRWVSIAGGAPFEASIEDQELVLQFPHARLACSLPPLPDWEIPHAT